MSERWYTEQDEHRARTLAMLEDQATSAQDLATEHRANALLGSCFSGVVALAVGAEEYIGQRWGYKQDLISVVGGLSLGYAMVQYRLMHRERKTAFERWQTAAQYFLED